MSTVGVLARFEVRPGYDDEVAAFFAEGLTIVEGQPSQTRWFAFREGPTSYGAFAAFASDEDRAALLAAGGPQLSKKYQHLFAAPPTFVSVEILQSRVSGPTAI